MDRSEGQEACLNPSASSITVPITVFTLTSSLSYFISNASLSCSLFYPSPALFFLSLFSNYNSSIFCFKQHPPSNLSIPNSFLLLAHFFVSWSLAIFLLSPILPLYPISLFIVSSPSPSALLLSPKGLGLTAVDYHTSKELSSLSPVGPISCPIEHQCTQVFTGKIFHVVLCAGICIYVDKGFLFVNACTNVCWWYPFGFSIGLQ